MSEPLAIGRELEVEVGPLVHGGHCLAHAEGRTVFVRHALPGERVRIRVTGGAARVDRADAVQIVRSAPERVDPACRHAGVCGGCDFQHIEPAAQRRLLSTVVTETLRRVGGIDRQVEVRSVPGGPWGWRTRMVFAVDDDGRLGLRRHRSHHIVPIVECPIAHPELGRPWAEDREFAPGSSVTAVRSSTGHTAVVTAGAAARPVTERVRERNFEVAADGFWQVHPAAAETLVESVLRLGAPRPGERVVDLYCGAGLFTAFLAEAVGAGGTVRGVEGDRRAVEAARANLADLPQARVVQGAVERTVPPGPVDLVVLDPPRAGAKGAVAAIGALRPSRIVYVSCDIATQARDLAAFSRQGYRLADFEAYAVFPMTHHVETVALLTPIQEGVAP